MKNPFSQQLLFLKVKNKDPEAYGKFYDLYVERIYRFIYFKVSSRAEAQDLTSEVFLKLWQYIKDDRDIKNINPFIYVIARNLVIDFYRQRSTKQGKERPHGAGACEPSDGGELAIAQSAKFDLQLILKGLENLKDEYKEIIILRFLDELSIGEIAEITKKSHGSVRVIIHRALRALKENIDIKK